MQVKWEAVNERYDATGAPRFRSGASLGPTHRVLDLQKSLRPEVGKSFGVLDTPRPWLHPAWSTLEVYPQPAVEGYTKMAWEDWGTQKDPAL